jgi:hypothetical protein
MTHYSYELDEGYFASLQALSWHLTAISHNVHQWGVIAVPGILTSAEGDPRSYALIGYSNPGPFWLINTLCFLAPLVALGNGLGPTPDLIVSCSPKSMRPLTKGIYFEDGELKYDPFEDFDRVWSPIKRRLWPQYGEGQIATPSQNGLEGVGLESQDRVIQSSSHDYRDEFLSYLATMVESRDLINAAVNY